MHRLDRLRDQDARVVAASKGIRVLSGLSWPAHVIDQFLERYRRGDVALPEHVPEPLDYLPECLDWKDGKAYTNQRPGLGVTLDLSKVKQVGEITAADTQHIRQNFYRRPDGSLTHW